MRLLSRRRAHYPTLLSSTIFGLIISLFPKTELSTQESSHKAGFSFYAAFVLDKMHTVLAVRQQVLRSRPVPFRISQMQRVQ